MPTGKIKKLVHDRGFGFIQGEDGRDVFFHHSAVTDQGFDMLTEGQHVEFSVDEGGRDQRGKGPRASVVNPK